MASFDEGCPTAVEVYGSVGVVAIVLKFKSLIRVLNGGTVVQGLWSSKS